MTPLEAALERARRGISLGLETILAKRILVLEKENKDLNEKLHNLQRNDRGSEEDVSISPIRSTAKRLQKGI